MEITSTHPVKCVPIKGILLTNTGTPEAPTTKAVRHFLREFLSDRRMIHLPRIIWLPILHGLILRIRPSRSVKFYQQIWTQDGSPMRTTMKNLSASLQDHLNQTTSTAHFEVEIGMNYGQPSIQQGLENLKKKNVNGIFILPLFPQFSHTTTSATIDRVFSITHDWFAPLQIQQNNHYATYPAYINALAHSVRQARTQRNLTTHLLISFHGIPKRFVQLGDPYEKQCQQTADSLAAQLNLAAHEWTLCYQSRFGYRKWLQPSTQKLLATLPQRGIKHLDVICPGFPVDCLETLEEIAIRGKQTFLQAGGLTFHYIPALNDSVTHIQLLKEIIFAGF